MNRAVDVVEARRQAQEYLQQHRQDAPDVWLSTDQAAQYVGCPTRAAFRMWAKRAGIALLHRGRRVIVHRRELEAELLRQNRKAGR